MERLLRVKSVAYFLVFLSLSLQADYAYKIENTNFTLSQDSILSDKTYLYNYDRLRLRADLTQDGFFATFIGDGVNYYGAAYTNSLNFSYIKRQEADTPFNTQTSFREYKNGASYAKLYRLYGGYEDDENRVIIGLQNISMGVGRIWNPTNLFNPRNTYALEPDETFGVAAISYTRHLSRNADLKAVISQKADNSLKYAGQYKAFLDFADVGIDVVSSDETKMLGYEIEGNLGESGVEVRSEGAYIKNQGEFFQGIIGADYGFVNGVTLTAEALYSSKSFSYEQILLNYDSEIVSNLMPSNFSTALSLAYSFNIYLDGSLTYIESFSEDYSHFVAPTLTYTLNDYNSFTLGAMFQTPLDTYYLRWMLSF
jgi:hypothetical protein